MGVTWADSCCLMHSGTIMVATHFLTLHNLAIIMILPPQHVCKCSKSCGNRHMALNSMESIAMPGEDGTIDYTLPLFYKGLLIASLFATLHD